MTEEIYLLEEKINNLESELSKDENATNYEKAMEINLKIEESRTRLDDLYGEWSEIV